MKVLFQQCGHADLCLTRSIVGETPATWAAIETLSYSTPENLEMAQRVRMAKTF